MPGDAADQTLKQWAAGSSDGVMENHRKIKPTALPVKV
ncbi:hypothetical protein I551_0418 [Mycobacterium ulcerans str. Harvey]|uniref:Uncharacterized protein n=1 Tax=Mycobacterium ulcerans str. Harvey TaxID=1299332 RepID=A0ABN0R7F4_MYCUL|nr:hypothetical protein I551_0418 [Mycobacterium ulcerans str. Harvey]